MLECTFSLLLRWQGTKSKPIAYSTLEKPRPKKIKELLLNALSIDRIKSTATIMSLVGCSRSTAKNMLYKLVNEGKVNKIEIECGCHGWQRIKGD
jgi:hypothetical protein